MRGEGTSRVKPLDLCVRLCIRLDQQSPQETVFSTTLILYIFGFPYILRVWQQKLRDKVVQRTMFQIFVIGKRSKQSKIFAITYFITVYICIMGNKFREMIIYKKGKRRETDVLREGNGGKRTGQKYWEKVSPGRAWGNESKKPRFRYKLYVFRIFLHVTTVF